MLHQYQPLLLTFWPHGYGPQLDSSVSYIIANASALRQRSLNTINPINRECERTPTAQSDYPIIHESRKRAHSDSAVRLNQSQNPDISALGTQGSRSIATGHLVRLTRLTRNPSHQAVTYIESTLNNEPK